MAGYVYLSAEPGDAYAPTVQANSSVKIDGELFHAMAEVTNLHLSRDQGYDFDMVCPVFMFLHGRDDRVFSLYANRCGLLARGVRLPIEFVLSWH